MSGDEIAATQRPIRGCQTFNNSYSLVHVAVFLGGVVLWVIAYVACVLLFGSPELVSSSNPEGLFLRQVSLAVTGGIVGLYFAAAYSRALGAPLPNLIAASAITVLMPSYVRTLGGTPPYPAILGDSFLVSAIVLAAGSGVTILTVISWYYLRFGGTGTEAAEQWESANFPPGFRLAMSGTQTGEIDWEEADYGLGEWSFWKFFRHGALVFVGGMFLYGLVLASQRLVGELLLLQILEETPWLLLAGAGIVYIWWLNRRWRINFSGQDHRQA